MDLSRMTPEQERMVALARACEYPSEDWNQRLDDLKVYIEEWIEDWIVRAKTLEMASTIFNWTELE